MSLGLVGRKVGMTRVFADDGTTIPVTVLDVSNNRVTQIKTPETDGYAAVQVAFGKRRASRVNKAAAGHLAKAGVEAGEVLKEFRVAQDQLANFKAGDVIAVSIFAVGQKVDARVTLFDRRTRKVAVSIKALEVAEEKEAIAQYGSSDSGATLGDILGTALKRKGEEAEKE